jgi:hypothetical protein
MFSKSIGNIKQIITVLFVVGSIHLSYGQGSNTVLFSICGDTVLTRTSCYCKTEDTLTTYFTVLENRGGNLILLSVFEIREPGKNSIPCADFKLVPPDTIAKYKLFNVGTSFANLDDYGIVSTLQSNKKTKNEKGEKVYARLIKHEFQLQNNTFFSMITPDLAEKKNEPIIQPRTQRIFGYQPLNKYHFEIIVEQNYLHPESKKTHTNITHLKIGN